MLISSELAISTRVVTPIAMPKAMRSLLPAFSFLPCEMERDVALIHLCDSVRWTMTVTKNATPTTSCRKSPVSWKNISNTSKAVIKRSNTKRPRNLFIMHLSLGMCHSHEMQDNECY